MALDVITSISLDMQNPYSTTDMVHVNQYDSGLRVKATLLNAGQKWEVPSGAKAVVAFKKSDNIGGFYDATDDDPSVQAVSIDNNRSIIYISLDAQTTTTPTTANQYVDMQVVFYENGKRLSTFAFYMDVRPSVVASKDITSSWVFHILAEEIASTLNVATTPDAMREWLETNIHPYQGYPIDDTLTIPGAASDAAATGKMVTVSDQNPNTVANKVWVKKTPYEVQVPTMEEISGLKSATIVKSNTEANFWHIGYWASTTGLGYNSNTKYLRTNQTIDNTIFDIECSDEYLMYLTAYDEHTYIGEWDGVVFRIPSSTAAARSDARTYYDIQSIRDQYPSYILRLTVIRLDNEVIDLNDACNSIFINRIVSIVNQNTININNGELTLSKFWENGTIDTNGNKAWNDNCFRRLSTIQYFKFTTPVEIIPKPEYVYSIVTYNLDGVFESISDAWQDTAYIFSNPNKLYRINIRPEHDINDNKLFPSRINDYLESHLIITNASSDLELLNEKIQNAENTIDDLNEKIDDSVDLLNKKIEDTEDFQTWKVGVIASTAQINSGNGAIPNAARLDEYSRMILADGCSVVCFYFSDEYLGKIAADHSINKTSSDWGHFRKEFDPHLYAPENAEYFLVVVCPEDGTTLTNENVTAWAKAHCEFVAYKNNKNDRLIQTQIDKLSNDVRITDYAPKYINYNYDEKIISMGQPSLNTGDRLTVIRNGTKVIINGTSGTSNAYIKISGSFTKTAVAANLTDGITLENGHTYRVSWNLISGTVMIPTGKVNPYVLVLPLESSTTIGRPNYGLNGYRDFIYDGTEVNLCLFIQKGALEFSKAEYSITLEDLSARYNIAPYYVSELLDTVEKARNLNDEPSLVFPVITDIHRYAVDWQNFNRSIENMMAFNKYVKCDFIVNLGDSMDGNIPVADSLILAQNTTECFMNTGIPYYFVNGNHDTNYRYTETFDIKQNYKAFYTATKNAFINPDTYGTDYYVNFDSLGVRLICLNVCNSMVHLPFAYGASTAAWLAQVLDPNYKILLCEHMSSIPSQNYNINTAVNCEAITSVLQNFVNNGGSLIQFTGHTHADIAFALPWINIVQAASRLATVSADHPNIQKITGYIDAITTDTRTPFTASEDLWSVCIYKPISNVIHTIRFGSGNDRHFHVTPIEPQTVSTILDGVITWSTSDVSVATVNNGTISRVGPGMCAILAKDTNGNYECWTVKNN